MIMYRKCLYFVKNTDFLSIYISYQCSKRLKLQDVVSVDGNSEVEKVTAISGDGTDEFEGQPLSVTMALLKLKE